jgi:hypothetical protein
MAAMWSKSEALMALLYFRRAADNHARHAPETGKTADECHSFGKN